MNIYHLARLLPVKARKCGDKTILRYRDNNENRWRSISWKDLDKDVRHAASSMIEYGVSSGDHVGLFSRNKPECICVDFACFSIRAASVPMYATSTASQIEYMIKDAGIELLFAGEQYQYDRAFEAMNAGSGLRQIIVFDTDVRLAESDDTTIYMKDFLQRGYVAGHSDDIDIIRQEATPEDLANILYTSGTSGEPKGVIITHRMYLESIRANDIKLSYLSDNEVSLSFLPMTHIFEKTWNFFCMMHDIRTDINLNPADIQVALLEVRPTCMCCVPRFWEKVYNGINERLGSMPHFAGKLFEQTVRKGRKYNLDYLRHGLKPPLGLSISYFIIEKTIFRYIKGTIGINKGNMFPVAGAKFSDELCAFFRSIGVPIVYGYGLTESTATVSCFDRTNYNIGTVGSIIEGLQVRIGEDGEILLKGETITPGYYKKPQVNVDSFTSDGFFRTGDAGYIEEHGHLIVKERIKDLFKTSNGKYIAPQQIETTLTADKFIDMAAVIGDDRKYVSALIVPDYSLLPELSSNLGIKAGTIEEMLSDERMYDFFETRIRILQKNMAGFEQVKKFTLLSEPFTLEKGELTNTFKLRRKVILQNYAGVINAMY